MESSYYLTFEFRLIWGADNITMCGKDHTAA